MFKNRQPVLRIQLSLGVVYTLISAPVLAQEVQKNQAKFLLSATKQELSEEPASNIETLPKAVRQSFVANPAPGIAQESDAENYSISWSYWVAELINRWLLNLRNAESFYGLQFETLKPALFQFTCYADGHIDNVILRQSSGILLYDKLQMATLLKVAPLPPFPKGTRRTNLTLVQGWESHLKQPGEQEFEPWNFANKFPQEKISIP